MARRKIREYHAKRMVAAALGLELKAVLVRPFACWDDIIAFVVILFLVVEQGVGRHERDGLDANITPHVECYAPIATRRIQVGPDFNFEMLARDNPWLLTTQLVVKVCRGGGGCGLLVAIRSLPSASWALTCTLTHARSHARTIAGHAVWPAG